MARRDTNPAQDDASQELNTVRPYRNSDQKKHAAEDEPPLTVALLHMCAGTRGLKLGYVCYTTDGNLRSSGSPYEVDGGDMNVAGIFISAWRETCTLDSDANLQQGPAKVAGYWCDMARLITEA
ncbi:hypothetical protein E4U17_004396 [Claviceps sp. LM77 group G4]|nr:hypothetical protein E4U17_004396 [Claviceps sp. LM77 group G4]KAG6070049.1 hypothetical protein E4U33_004424 [Claviceps sp. LM78 group G4]KAG6081594.1 hypothetical protein E4U16_007191 [Claviceps sp. LM84 group G4]